MAYLTVDEIARAQDVQNRRLDSHSEGIRDLELWRAQMKGFLLALTIFASLPTVLLGWMALTGGLTP